jgi:hypothetical protein
MNKGTRQNENKKKTVFKNGARESKKIKTKNATTFLRLRIFKNPLGVVIAK